MKSPQLCAVAPKKFGKVCSFPGGGSNLPGLNWIRGNYIFPSNSVGFEVVHIYRDRNFF